MVSKYVPLQCTKLNTYTPVEGEGRVRLELQPQNATELDGAGSASAGIHAELHPEGVVGGPGGVVEKIRHVSRTDGGLRHGAGQSGPSLQQLLDNLLKTANKFFISI